MPRFSLMLAAAATAALPIVFLAAGPAGAATLHPVPAVVSPDASQATVQEVRHRRHRSSGTIYFGFGFGTPYFGPGGYYYDPYYPRYYEPYYAPRYYEPVPPPRYYEPTPPPRYYEPAPYTGSTGRCPSGQHFRYPVGCVPN
jgi:hypothetical protein